MPRPPKRRGPSGCTKPRSHSGFHRPLRTNGPRPQSTRGTHSLTEPRRTEGETRRLDFDGRGRERSKRRWLFCFGEGKLKLNRFLGREQLVETLSAHGSGRVGAEWHLGLAFQGGPNRWHGAWAFKRGHGPTTNSGT
ncbi:hypothetical protein Salat_1917600 [Sesamum alatum]|uniref:Uncharacterized protein n=1 Tax=Sesamum alatum TaxID=300844 RepID=A0AAE2CIF0_9LAMI|nr:hypothetical protein Salat_1917600 [Sesamum alatum]